MQLEIVYLSPDELTPYKQNTRRHAPHDIDQIKESILADGFNDPIGVWGEDNIIVEGHGRQIAAKELGMEKVPCIRLDHLTDTQRKEYAIRHNRTAELSAWDFGKLEEEIAALEIQGVDLSGLEFDLDNGEADWFDREERDGTKREDGNDEYNDFLDKFEAKKTTDDCYTPDNVYDAVANWVADEYGVDRAAFVRPFYPGGDYQAFRYPAGCAVVDNPPFSILAQIVDFYNDRGIRYFLFAPGLNVMGYAGRHQVCAVCTGVGVTYENGACVSTSFVTNMEPDDTCARTAPSLYAAVDEANDENEKAMHVQMPKYEFPDEVITAAKMGWMAKYGQDFKVKRGEALHIRTLDAMKEKDKAIFGSAFLLSERAAAERAAAEKWQLSEREKEIVRGLGK